VVRSIEFPAATRQEAIDISGLAEGIYLVRILFADETVAIQKVIKR
jgi:hypothetical protein